MMLGCTTNLLFVSCLIINIKSIFSKLVFYLDKFHIFTILEIIKNYSLFLIKKGQLYIIILKNVSISNVLINIILFIIYIIDILCRIFIYLVIPCIKNKEYRKCVF
jgi:hypothetical protein